MTYRTRVNYCPALQMNGDVAYCTWRGLELCPHENREDCDRWFEIKRVQDEKKKLEGKKHI